MRVGDYVRKGDVIEIREKTKTNPIVQWNADVLDRTAIEADVLGAVDLDVDDSRQRAVVVHAVIAIAEVDADDADVEINGEWVEHGFGHSASMHSHDIQALSTMAREINTSIFVKNGPIVAGLAAGGEGFTSFTIASPTGEGLTTAKSFSRQRRCVMVDHFRIV